ncbi:MAG: acetamidase/formamidase family protein [Bifidobacteriaceae bacterium]|jgi:amidase|nr:acetamidase/formamidase family protein [Bifidobacteriaceae bacterium]
MVTVEATKAFHAFSPDLTPAARVEQGEQLHLITQDCFGNQLHSAEDKLDGLDWSTINPATGPVYIEGVRAGDIVRIQILSLTPTGHATMVAIPGDGALADRIVDGETTIVENLPGAIILPTARGPLRLEAVPMIGVIGLAPASGAVPNGTPGVHGGNMDCRLIGAGATVYFRAEVDGGLFGCGDVHSLMADGEVLVCGAETPAEVTVVPQVVQTKTLPVPFFENADIYAAIASASTTDAAYKLATDNMHTFLTEIVGLTVGDAGRLMSLVGDLKFCQVVDPQVTVRAEFPKAVLADLGFTEIA